VAQLAIAAALVLPGCAGTPSYAGIPLLPGAADAQLQALARRAQGGDKAAQLELGVRYEEARGVRRDLAKAEKLYRAATKASGGVSYVYNPGGTKAGSGSLLRLDHGPRRAGLPAARERLERLQRQRKTIRKSSGSTRLEKSS
jgi:TPR repeat protein